MQIWECFSFFFTCNFKDATMRPAANRTDAFAVIRRAQGELKAQTSVVDSCGDKLTLTSPTAYVHIPVKWI